MAITFPNTTALYTCAEKKLSGTRMFLCTQFLFMRRPERILTRLNISKCIKITVSYPTKACISDFSTFRPLCQLAVKAVISPSTSSSSSSLIAITAGSMKSNSKSHSTIMPASKAVVNKTSQVASSSKLSTNDSQGNNKRRKVGMACIYCRRSHMTCDDGRPCKRCIKRDIGHLCHDETTNRNASSSNTARRSSSTSNHSTPSSKPLSNLSPNQTSSQSLPTSAIVNVLGGSSNGGDPMLNDGSMSQIDVGNGLHQLPQMRMAALQNEMINNPISSVTPNWAAASMLGGASFLGLGGGDLAGAGNGYSANGDAAGGNEYNILSEFLESLDGTNGMPSTPLPTSLNQNQSISSTLNGKREESDQNIIGTSDESNTANGTSTAIQANLALHRNRDRRASLADTSILVAGANKADTFFLTAADQKDGTRDERLGRVIQAKLDAGLLRPYNHVNGYARLNKWMEQNCSQSSRRRILKPISIFRPAFRAVAQRLTNVDLIFIEEAFERLLLDYDRVFSTQGIPACLWRRTGEIYKGNKEFADLVGVNFDELREGRCTIYELMQEESAVNYWEKYGAVCFDPGQKAVLTSCILRTNQKKKNGRSGTLSNSISNLATPVIGMTRTSSLTNQDAKSTRSEIGKENNAKINKEPHAITEEGTEASKSIESQEDYLSCCFSFTIRRDAWGIPYAIVGNFLPLDR